MTLHIRNVSKTYPNGVQALKDVNLTISSGMYGLLGPNGSGKSTLMRTIATLQEPDQGSLRLGEIDVLKQKDEVRKTLGYLPQEFGVYPKVSAEDLLYHFAILKGIGERRARRNVVEDLLKQVNLWEVRRQKLGGSSGGMKQRFGVAVALLGNPKPMIVDEPTAGLDPAERVRSLNLLAVQAGILLAVYSPGMHPDAVGPFRLAAYVTAYAFIALPNAFVGTAIQFSLAARSGRAMASYLGRFLLFFMAFFVASSLLFKRGLGTLLDPIGIRFIVEDLSHLWTTIEKSWRLIELEGTVLTNRLLWLGIALGALAVTYLRFRFAHRAEGNCHTSRPAQASTRTTCSSTWKRVTASGR